MKKETKNLEKVEQEVEIESKEEEEGREARVNRLDQVVSQDLDQDRQEVVQVNLHHQVDRHRDHQETQRQVCSARCCCCRLQKDQRRAR